MKPFFFPVIVLALSAIVTACAPSESKQVNLELFVEPESVVTLVSLGQSPWHDERSLAEKIYDFRDSPELKLVEYGVCIEQYAKLVIEEEFRSLAYVESALISDVIDKLPIVDNDHCDSVAACRFEKYFQALHDTQEGLISGATVSKTLSDDDLADLRVTPIPDALTRAAFEIAGIDYAERRLDQYKSMKQPPKLQISTETICNGKI